MRFEASPEPLKKGCGRKGSALLRVYSKERPRVPRNLGHFIDELRIGPDAIKDAVTLYVFTEWLWKSFIRALLPISCSRSSLFS